MSPVQAWVLMVALMLPAVEARGDRPIERSYLRHAGRPALAGFASWYGWQFNGRLMANGRRFRALELSAASPVLPLGTRVRVTNVENGRSVDLQVTDRGPFVRDRLLDVSLGAAKQLRMVERGVVRVRIELISVPS